MVADVGVGVAVGVGDTGDVGVEVDVGVSDVRDVGVEVGVGVGDVMEVGVEVGVGVGAGAVETVTLSKVAEVVTVLLWLETAKPTNTFEAMLSVSEPRNAQFTPSLDW